VIADVPINANHFSSLDEVILERCEPFSLFSRDALIAMSRWIVIDDVCGLLGAGKNFGVHVVIVESGAVSIRHIRRQFTKELCTRTKNRLLGFDRDLVQGGHASPFQHPYSPTQGAICDGG